MVDVEGVPKTPFPEPSSYSSRVTWLESYKSTMPDIISLYPVMLWNLTLPVVLYAHALTAMQERARCRAANGADKGSTHTPDHPSPASIVNVLENFTPNKALDGVPVGWGAQQCRQANEAR